MCLIGDFSQFWPGICTVPACIWPIILGSQNLLLVGRGRRKAGSPVLGDCYPILAGYLIKVTLISVIPRTKSQTFLYHVKFLLVYFNSNLTFT